MSNPNDNSTALALSEGTQIEILAPTALEAITRGEVDVQISTAHKYPRSIAKFKGRAIEMACIDQSTAESTIYCRPVGKKDGKMQYAEGLSVRMAEIVGACYGNLRVGSTIIEQTDRYVIVRGFAHDLESNFASSSEVKEPTVTKEGRPFSEGMRAVIAKAALSKARRDATFQVVPKALCRPIELAARSLIAGDAKSLEARRTSAVNWAQRLNINEDRVWKSLGVHGPEDLTSEHLMTLTGIRNSIKDGDATIDDAFPEILPTGKVGATAAGSVTEAAAKEKADKEKPAETPAKKAEETPKEDQTVGPSAKALLDSIIAKGSTIDAGKVKIEKACVALRYLEPSEKLDKCDAKKLADILDGWEEIQDAIMNPAGSK